MTPEQLDAIEARANAATPGPWELVDWFGAVDPGRTDLGSPIGEVGCDLTIADAELIAHAPTDIEALITEVERLRDLQRAVNTVLDLVEDEEVVNMFARVVEAQDALLTVARKIR